MQIQLFETGQVLGGLHTDRYKRKGNVGELELVNRNG